MRWRFCKAKIAWRHLLVAHCKKNECSIADYIMVMVANKKTQKQMQNDLEIFLHQVTAE